MGYWGFLRNLSIRLLRKIPLQNWKTLFKNIDNIIVQRKFGIPWNNIGEVYWGNMKAALKGSNVYNIRASVKSLTEIVIYRSFFSSATPEGTIEAFFSTLHDRKELIHTTITRQAKLNKSTYLKNLEWVADVDSYLKSAFGEDKTLEEIRKESENEDLIFGTDVDELWKKTPVEFGVWFEATIEGLLSSFNNFEPTKIDGYLKVVFRPRTKRAEVVSNFTLAQYTRFKERPTRNSYGLHWEEVIAKVQKYHYGTFVGLSKGKLPASSKERYYYPGNFPYMKEKWNDFEQEMNKVFTEAQEAAKEIKKVLDEEAVK